MKKRTLIGLVLALIFSCFQMVSANAADALVNAELDANGGGWTGARFSGTGNPACTSGQPNIGTWQANALNFSYVKTTVYQDVVISKPSLVQLTFDVQNRNDQHFTRWFSADLGTATTGNFTPSTTVTTKTLTFQTTVANEVVRVAFTGQDQLTWAGCYGSIVNRISLTFPKVVVVEPEKVFLPYDLLATTAPSFTRIGDYVSCTLGNYGYRDARNSTGPITAKDLDSATILLRNGSEVIGTASTDAYVNYPRSLLGLKDSADDVKITSGAASWKLSGVASTASLSCQILAYKEHQITYTTVK
jgi:hypothetical protein